MLKKSLLYLFTALALVACSDDDDDNISTNTNANNAKIENTNSNPAKVEKAYSRLEFPRIGNTNKNIILVHETANGEINYCVEWDINKKSQRWSCYQMYKSIMIHPDTVKRYQGNPQYPQDPLLAPEYQWGDNHLYHTGYDHGHICPSADRLQSKEGNYQTFFTTNMQPQKRGFNAGVWEHMESKVRDWAKQNNYKFCDTMYVCKGGTIDKKNQIMTTLSNGIIVPKYFYMAILISKKQPSGTIKYDAMAFWVEHAENNDKGQALAKYVISIDELEQKTGIDFFCNLPDDIERKVESTVNMKLWGYN